MYKGQSTKPINNKAIHSYIQMKMFRSQCTFTITCEGEMYWTVNGHKMSDQQFNEMYPLGLLNRETKGKRIGNSQQIY